MALSLRWCCCALGDRVSVVVLPLRIHAASLSMEEGTGVDQQGEAGGVAHTNGV